MELAHLLNEMKASRREDDQFFKLLQEIATLDKDRITNLPKIKTKLIRLDSLLSQPTQRLPRSVSQWATQYKQDLSEAEAQVRKNFGINLEQALKSLSMSLTGQYPELKAGLFTFKLDFEKDRVAIWYGNEQEKLDECRVLADDVAKRVENLLKNLGSGLEQDVFIEKLRQAYRRTVGGVDNQPVPIIQVLPEVAFLIQGAMFLQEPLREHYRSYSRADFSYDLYRYGKKAVSHGLRLTIAVRANTRRRTDFLWIPDDDRGHGTAYSHIQFEEPTS